MLRPVKRGKNKQYAVLGLGKFGKEAVKALTDNGCEVLAVDKDSDNVNAVAAFATHAVVGDVAEEKVLKELGIDSFDVVVVGIGEDLEASVVCTLICKEMGVKYVIAKASSKQHETILKRIGVDRIIIPEADSAQRLAKLLLYPGLSEIIELEGGFSIAEITVPDVWNGAKLMDLKIRNKYNVNALLIISENTSTVPKGDTVLVAGEKLVVGANIEDINALLDKINAK